MVRHVRYDYLDFYFQTSTVDCSEIDRSKNPDDSSYYVGRVQIFQFSTDRVGLGHGKWNGPTDNSVLAC